MSAVETANELKALARNRSPADRERLMLAIIDLCGKPGDAVRTPAIQQLLGSILTGLVNSAEQDLRRIMAEKLSATDWLPPALINLLALDKIEIARSVIAKSPVLRDADLAQLLLEGAVDHRIEVAKRPLIASPVVETILEQAQPAVMIALAGNDTAEVSPQSMRRMVEASRQVAGMRSPLARHPRLTSEMAKRLYAWVGQSLRSAIVNRFPMDIEAPDRTLAEAVTETRDTPFHDPAPRNGLADAEQEEMERRLIAKLRDAGRLRPSYLLRALREQRLSLFASALAALGDFSSGEVNQALKAERPEALALACATVGLDRGAFSTLLALVRGLNRGLPGGDAGQARRIFDAFGPGQTAKARAAFTKAAATV
ncbi:MAG TPA: DUF2336 domain-containing protein [Caulobacteraceae bacterium]|nr:DUF2336 domain-containing protein [Caulobacteraceae bacterium]